MKKILIVLITVLLFSSSIVYGKEDDYQKNETVYVSLNADGEVKKIKVEDWLKITSKNQSIEDSSILENIKNKDGDEEYKKNNDSLIWENKGEDILYQGESSKELPIDIKTTYYLDGKKIKANEIIGKSGKVKIRFDYTNNETKEVNIDKKTYHVHVPFLCATALILPTEHFSNVKISNGKIMDSKEQNIVIGAAFPRIKDDLMLDKYDSTKDIDLPDYIEIEADAKDFVLELSTTIVSTIGLNDIDEVNDIENLINGISTLTNATSKITSASQQLNSGMTSIKTYLNQYFNFIDHLTHLIDGIDV